MKKTERVPTGIPGFDKLIQGGFPKKSSVLICGGPGSGKSIFGMQFLVNGALKYKEKGLYITFEQEGDAVKAQAAQFGWDLKKLEKEIKVKVIAVSIEDITKKVIDDIKDMVKKDGIKRLVIDSLSTLIVNAPIYTTPSELSVQDVVGSDVIFSPPIIGDYVVKRFIYKFIDQLRDLDCTTLLISEAASQVSEYLTRDTLSEFVCDGVVLLTLQETLNMRRVQIRKLRGTVHPLKPVEFELTNKGIVVENEDEK